MAISGRRERDARIKVPDDERNLLVHEPIGDSYSLFEIAAIVGRDDDELLTQNAATRVDVCSRLFGAVAQLCAEDCIRAAQRRRERDLDLKPVPG